jgi:hypothetical protein
MGTASRFQHQIQDGEMDFGAGSGLNGLFKIGQTVYELVAVTEQAHDLLDSANHVSASVETVRSLRHQKSGLLQTEEKRWVDRVINDTEKTLNNVASLVEPARVDMQTKFGKIGLVNRALFVFRDSPKVATNLARLTLTGQSLNTALTMLSSREGALSKATRAGQDSDPSPLEPTIRIQEAIHLPPSYQESELLSRKRLSRSKPSSTSLRKTFGPTTTSVPPPVPLNSKPMAFMPVSSAFSELFAHQISELQTSGEPSDYKYKPYKRPLETSYLDGAQRQVLDIPFSSVKTQTQEPELSDARRCLPYPHAQSQNSESYEMPDQDQYGYHAVSPSYLETSAWRDIASRFPPPPLCPPYPVFQTDFQGLISRTQSCQREHDSLVGLSHEDRGATKLCYVDSRIPVCLQLGQELRAEPLENHLSPEEFGLQRKSTARQTRRQWYADNAVRFL